MQNDYNFWADLFDTYQSLTVGLQTGWMLALLIFATIVTMLIFRQFDNIFDLWRRRQRRLDKRKNASDAGYQMINALPGPLGDPGLYRVMADEDGVPYLEQVGTVPQLDWDGSDKE
ncbi:MAG: hypothetical protein MJH08_01470 [Hyphomicrobiales bacterium]|nr:hypothetical protein [Hyphomicrobiales bacterium]